jgi:hypothetical protein
LIENEIEKTYTPTKDGVYSVKVTIDGCENTSDPTANIIAGVEDDLMNPFTISPNPATTFVRITGSRSRPLFYNTLGIRFELQMMETAEGSDTDISSLSAGVYIIKIDGRSRKMIKQ